MLSLKEETEEKDDLEIIHQMQMLNFNDQTINYKSFANFGSSEGAQHI